MKVVLCILDGWGYSSCPSYNAIDAANAPNWSRLVSSCEVALLDCSGGAVGLPDGFIGNSEVGHLTIGAGKIVEQSLLRINKGIGCLTENPSLQSLVYQVKSGGGKVHVVGLLSPGGVHSHISHIDALLVALRRLNADVCFHAILDGRDVAPRSCLDYLDQYSPSTLSGRYYAMDRDQRWDRTKLAYENIMHASGDVFSSAVAGVLFSYEKELDDEFIEPFCIAGYRGVKSEDGFIIANFRSDRVWQLLSALLGEQEFSSGNYSGAILGMVPYGERFNIPSLFPPNSVENTLGEVVSRMGLRQLRLAETEKFHHVTFFLNGCQDTAFPGEDRVIVPSPKVAFYDLVPEMSARLITSEFVSRWMHYDLIVMNYANADMVGHTGNFEAAKKAVEAVDESLGVLCSLVESSTDPVCLLITSDHGNAEMMYDQVRGVKHTAHTLNQVPFLGMCNGSRPLQLESSSGALASIAPTVLALLGLEAPIGMAESLVSKEEG